jgi:hypothetical protein
LANRFADQIERLLSPLIGDFIAKMAVKSQCKSLGITPDQISAQHLDPLSKKIGDALAFHGHKGEASNIIRKIASMA